MEVNIFHLTKFQIFFLRWEILRSIFLLLLLSHFSRVQLCVTPETAAHQAPPPGNLPDPGIKPLSLTYPALPGGFFTINLTWEAQFQNAAAAAAKSLQLCPTLCDPIDGKPTRLPCPWDSPGKNTGVDCHFLLQCMKVKSESEVKVRRSVVSDCSWPHGLQPTRLPRPWDFPGKSTGVGCIAISEDPLS